jgi:hypothetical protein
MSTETVRLSDLAKLGAKEQETRLRNLVGATRRAPNGELGDLDARIRAHESRAGYDSETLRRRLLSGDEAETPEVCDWLMLLDLRERIASVVSRPR